MKRRYLTLVVLFLFIIAVVGLDSWTVVPFKYEWVLTGLLFLVLLTLVGATGLIGVAAPMDRRAMQYVYSILVALPIAIFATFFFLLEYEWFRWLWGWPLSLATLIWFGTTILMGAATYADRNTKAFLLLVISPLIVIVWLGFLAIAMYFIWWFELLFDQFMIANWGTYMAIMFVLVLVWLATSALVVAASLRTRLSDKPRTSRLYITVMLKALGISAAAFASTVVVPILAVPVIGLSVFFLVPLLVAVVVTAPGVVLIGTMRHPYQNIVVTAIGLWVMITAVGWYWPLTMDNGLGMFTGDDRAAAEGALTGGNNCSSFYAPIASRVVKDDSGGFRVLNRTWWRLPAPC